MIAVLSSRFDDDVRKAASAWQPGDDVVLLTLDDFLAPGWVVPTNSIADSMFVADGRILPARELTAVLNIIPQVYDFELLGIRRRDRRYVSAELFAFLVWWLRALPCPVLNRPTPGCLNGPSWSEAQWANACRRAAIPTTPVRRDSANTSLRAVRAGNTCSTTVIGEQAYGEVFPDECRTLAVLADTRFLQVFFRQEDRTWIFHGVNLLPSIQRPEIREMLASFSMFA